MREERWLNISERQVYKVVAGHWVFCVALAVSDRNLNSTRKVGLSQVAKSAGKL
jgi:hypothetical protein